MFKYIPFEILLISTKIHPACSLSDLSLHCQPTQNWNSSFSSFNSNVIFAASLAIFDIYLWKYESNSICYSKVIMYEEKEIFNCLERYCRLANNLFWIMSMFYIFMIFHVILICSSTHKADGAKIVKLKQEEQFQELLNQIYLIFWIGKLRYFDRQLTNECSCKIIYLFANATNFVLVIWFYHLFLSIYRLTFSCFFYIYNFPHILY